MKEKDFIPVKTLDKIYPKPDIKIDQNIFGAIKGKIFQLKFEGGLLMWKTIKDFIVAKLVQWILKLAGGALVALGISQGTVEEVIGGLVAAIVGIIYSLFTHQKVALSDPKLFQ